MLEEDGEAVRLQLKAELDEANGRIDYLERDLQSKQRTIDNLSGGGHDCYYVALSPATWPFSFPHYSHLKSHNASQSHIPPLALTSHPQIQISLSLFHTSSHL